MSDDDMPSPALSALAEAHGVSVRYWSFFGEHVTVPATTLRAILAAMGVDASTDAAAEAALAVAEEDPWRELLPPSRVVTAGTGELVAHVADGHDVGLSVHLEDGSWRDVPIPTSTPRRAWSTVRSCGGCTFPCPPACPWAGTPCTPGSMRMEAATPTAWRRARSW